MRSLFLCAAMISAPVMAAVPNTFTAGAPAIAADVNENFSYLDARVSSVGLSVSFRTATSQTGVVSASCATGETLVGGGCFCSGSSVDNESGQLFACAANVSATAYVGGCYPNTLGQAAIPIIVHANCASIGSSSAKTGISQLPVTPENMDEIIEAEQRLLQMIKDRRIP